MDDPQLKILLEHYQAGIATREELAQLNDWYSSLQQKEQSFFSQEEDKQQQLSQLLQVIHEQIKAPVVSKRRMPLKWMAAAAVILLSVTGWWLFQAKEAGHSAVMPTALATGTAVETAADHWKIQRNTTTKTITTLLPDGSVAQLAAGASLQYKKPFAANHKREVYINGQVYFEVAKEKKKPFTVYSGAFATTALGTSFSVDERKAGACIILFTGKVVIQSVGQPLKGWRKDVYLTPGEQMQYDAGAENVLVTRSGEAIAPEPVKRTLPGRGEANELVFETAPLTEVMDKLMKQYHVSIEYHKEDLAGMNFSGSMQKNDSLRVLLQAIGHMNGLTITPKANGFIVQPQPK
jgi:ferric-dicitrate binding protein FerR (iron transport regulator)